jgi:hypothetical protein
MAEAEARGLRGRNVYQYYVMLFNKKEKSNGN